MTRSNRQKWNKIVRTMPGGNELLDNIEAWHGRLMHFKREKRALEANLAQESLNDLNLIADAMRNFACENYKKPK